MAMLRLAAKGETPLIFDPEQGYHAPPLTVEAARAAAPALRKTRPLVVMVHGYKFDPYSDHAANPHEYLYHFDPGRAEVDRWRRPKSWPLGLGFSESDRYGIDGLCVGFAWSSKPQVRFGRFCAAYLEAERAGKALLKTLWMLAEAFPHRDIDILTHSLGARVALMAMRSAAVVDPSLLERVGRVILLGPAELTRSAHETMKAIDRAAPRRSPQVYSVVARENDVFDAMVERFLPKVGGVRPICLGAGGLGHERDEWLDLQLDSPALLEWLEGRGVSIGGGARRACHWGVYNRPGALEFYAAILRDREVWSIQTMRNAGIPTQIEQRWVRWWGTRLLGNRQDIDAVDEGEVVA